MKTENRLLVSMLVFALLFCGALPLFAATVAVIPAGNGRYTVQGIDFSGVYGADVVIRYDTRTLAVKQADVTQGSLMSGGLMMANTTVPGIIRLALVHASGASGTGPLATINFTLTGKSAGSVTVDPPKLIDASGRDIGASAQNEPVTDTTTSTTATTTTPTTTTTTSTPTTTVTTSPPPPSVPVIGGTLTMPGETPTPGEKEKVALPPTAPEPLQVTERPVAAQAEAEASRQRSEPPPAQAAVEKKFVPIKSVLEQFRLFQGEKSPTALMALFNNPAEGIRQEPPVALSDGSTKVKVIIARPSSGKDAPNFALKGAKLESLKTDGDAAWVVELLPNKGVYEATVTMLQDGALTEIPLTVAPPIAAGVKIGEGGKLTEADFKNFLKDRGTEKAPRFDLNGDWKRDYVDDYIFTANYVVKNVPVVKGTAQEKK